MKRNEYDNNKMMDDFDLEARRRKIFTTIKNKWKAVSNAYNEKIEEMKLKNEKLYMERDQKFKQKLKMKESSIKKQIELRNKLLQEKKKEQEEISKKKSDDIQKNLEEYYKKQEEKRLKLEQDTFNKCN
jgi:nucleoporin GLE1